MSKEEFLKIQTCVLKVNIHCDGCKQKVKKILQKIDGVYTTNIDSEQGKVTISGNVDPATLIKKLTKNGKHAEIWGALKANNNNQNQMNNMFKNLQIDSGSKGGQNKGQAPKGGGNNQPKGGLQAQNPQFQQQLQQLQQLKGLQDMKIPPQFMKDVKGANNNKDQNQKSVKFNLPEDEGFSDDDFDDDDFDDDDDDFDDEVDDIPVVDNKMKPPVLGNGHGGAQMGNIMMNNIINGQHPQFMKGGGNNGGNGGGNAKKGGGGGDMPVQMNPVGGDQNQGGANGGKKGGNGNGGNQNQGGANGGKKGGNGNGGNQNQGGGKGGKNGGGQPNDGKNGGGGQNKNGGGGGAASVNGNNSIMGNGAKKGGGNDGPHGMPNMMPMSAGGHVGISGTNMPMAQMGNNLPMGQMNNLAAVQGLPASAMAGGGGSGAGYFPSANPEHMTANPYYQQQLAAMVMNQQRANGNERFQPMMYARPPPAVNYMPPYPPYPYPYPYPHPHPYVPPHGERSDQYAMFSDENTSSCNVM